MGLLLSLIIFMAFAFSLQSSPFIQPLCHHDESSALLKFKHSFIIHESASYDPFRHSSMIHQSASCQKVASWTVEANKSDCCSWDGVECNKDTGHVIGLDLSSSCLFGSINSTSSLFRLVHLQSLNLAFNHFNYSHIPHQIRDLSRLTHLNLSWSKFSGQIPLEVSQLSHLSSLDLSQDYHDIPLLWYPHLELKKPTLRNLVGNLTRLQKLDLSGVIISSMVPNILANLSLLTFLSLGGCDLHGEFPIGIFKLSNLRVLSVPVNEGLTGYLPDFTWSSPLEELDFADTSFSGELPASMGNLGLLTELLLFDCNFSGSIPSSLGNLTKLTELALRNNSFGGNVPSSFGNLSKLNDLDLSNNDFVGNIPPSLENLVQLSFLDFSDNKLMGPIPTKLVNLPQLSGIYLSNNLLSGELNLRLINETQLEAINLSNNQLTGPVTLGPMNLTQLFFLDLSANKLHGQISKLDFNFENLQVLYLSENYLNGIVEFDKFVKLKDLIALDISGNQLSLLTKETSANATHQKFQVLGFSSCNLSKFPSFLKDQDELLFLNLSNNKIHGQVPEWMWNKSIASLQVLDLESNLLQGSLPIPPVSTSHFYISNNSLIGNVPKLFCNLNLLQFLDLANNNLSGSLPHCLDNFGASLLVLDLRRNKFQGSIPETWIGGGQLRIINFSQNKFQGHLPRLLAKCTWLRVLDLSDNQFTDIFPFWLGHLPNLEVLILRSNKFNGSMGTPQTYFKFPNLRILDISHNDFMGKLPLRLLENWKVKNFENVHLYSMMMTNKGNNLFYEKVQELLIAIDFSSNKFVGEIPESIGNLKGAQLLNLSNNALIGRIPSSLRNLTELETLDLSQNKLSGEIPQQLAQLTFLEVFSVSHNNLTGPIPQGRQFNTFENKSFQGNTGLCGRPLTRKCENSNEPSSHPSISQESQDFGSPFEFGWKIIVIGYGFGFVVGVIIGPIVIARKHDWLPTPTLDHKSSYFKLYPREPDYEKLRVFGCLYYPLLRPYGLHKLKYRFEPCTFLGYNYAGYKCLDPVTNKAYLSRHIIFDEDSFPAKDQATTHLPSKINAQGEAPFSLSVPFSLPSALPVSTNPNAATFPSEPVSPP
ncbi:receptor-like protein 7 [Corylus avellana]|uniref:receptor-like protein 7 n=1 Tax=Corylus avellana TaxID=13451 RepID=UPI00286D282E|nr:receptor-like protein 7 [Corylus avellana]